MKAWAVSQNTGVSWVFTKTGHDKGPMTMTVEMMVVITTKMMGMIQKFKSQKDLSAEKMTKKI